ncbi:glycoside hydrolase family 6 protein [Nonomuraea sp. NPDC048826]|uniref:glycoside hydrolase family 6 protein n=1 Tax=Nonomuraea sp. NPDC048826 TaxID=3364347 RepID=UPI00371E1FB1
MKIPRGLRKWAVTATAACVAAFGLVAGQTTAAHAAVACDVSYTSNQWSSGSSGGFTASITIKNLGDPLNGWTLTFDFPTTTQRYEQGWSATWGQQGTRVTAQSMPWNGNLATGASTSIGFNGTWSGSNPAPESFAINGTTCGDTAETPSVITSASSVAVAEGSTATFTARLSSAPSSNVTVSTTRTSGDTDLTVSSGASLTFTPSNWNTPQTVTLAAAQDSDTASGTAAFTVGGSGVTSATVNASEIDDDSSQEQSLIVTPTAVTVLEGGTGTYTVRLAAQPSGNVTVTSAAGSGDSDLTVSSGASLTFTPSNWNTAQTVTLAAAQDSDTTAGTRTFTVASTGLTSRTVTATEADDDGNPDPTHVENPYAGATGYVNPDWSAKAAAEPGGAAVANISTAVWMDRIAAIGGSADAMSLREHMDEAVTQDAANGATPLTIQVVIYNLPNRDCSALASNGELRIAQNGFNRYKAEYIDPIAAILDDPQYANLRIVTIIEPDSLPNLITNTDQFADCREADGPGGYRDGVRYALDKLHAITNVYTYIDAAHHAWLGWDSNFQPAVDLFYQTVAGAAAGVDSVDGFIVNTANYSALREPHFTINTTVNGTTVRQSDWVDWNFYIDEATFATALRNALIAKGFRQGLGMLVDTSRSGWGGTARPSGPSTSLNLNEFVDQSRVDRRIHAGNWCNQSGAGIGERPQASPAAGFDAYVWIKPPGESDGSSREIDNDQGKRFDRMCDPTYTGNDLNGNNLTGALADAPISGQWFSAQFRELVRNAYPPLS